MVAADGGEGAANGSVAAAAAVADDDDDDVVVVAVVDDVELEAAAVELFVGTVLASFDGEQAPGQWQQEQQRQYQ